MTRTWILQANPKLYDIEAALQQRPIIYWRIPQLSAEVKTGDRALIWRAGKDAGFVGWGVVRADPDRYDLSGEHDPFMKGGWQDEPGETYAPIRVWPICPRPTSAQCCPSIPSSRRPWERSSG